MTKQLLTVGLVIPGGFGEFVPLTAKRSLLDADIVIFRPSVFPFHRLEYPDSHFQGKPSFTDDASFQLKEAASHWRQQIQLALNAGKNVIMYLPALTEIFVD